MDALSETAVAYRFHTVNVGLGGSAGLVGEDLCSLYIVSS